MNSKQYMAAGIALLLAVALYVMPKNAIQKEEIQDSSSQEQTTTSSNSNEELSIEQKIQKAVELVQSGGAPMQGIMLLREVLEEDPTNAEANFQLGVFSIQSGQFDKGIARFENVLNADPSIIDAHYYLGYIYTQLGNKELAIENYTAFLNASDNDALKQEVQGIINELKI